MSITNYEFIDVFSAQWYAARSEKRRPFRKHLKATPEILKQREEFMNEIRARATAREQARIQTEAEWLAFMDAEAC